jgi:hypothetical protein
MTPTEFQYIKRAIQQLETTLVIEDRIKIQRAVSQILERSATKLEQQLVDSLA